MPRRIGSWERFHHHIRWSRPPRPAPTAAPAPVVPAVRRAIRPATRPSGASGPGEGRETSGLGKLIRSLWSGLTGRR